MANGFNLKKIFGDPETLHINVARADISQEFMTEATISYVPVSFDVSRAKTLLQKLLKGTYTNFILIKDNEAGTDEIPLHIIFENPVVKKDAIGKIKETVNRGLMACNAETNRPSYVISTGSEYLFSQYQLQFSQKPGRKYRAPRSDL